MHKKLGVGVGVFAVHNTNDQAYGDNDQNRSNFIDEQVHNFQVKIILTASV